MGVDLELLAEMRRGAQGPAKPQAALAAIKRWLDDEPPLPVLHRDRTKDGFLVVLHPAATPATFETVNNNIKFAARTSAVGPGYHATLVDILRDVERVAEVAWKETQEVHDDAGYFRSGNFEAMRGHFRAWLKKLCRAVLNQDSGGKGGFRLALSSELRPSVSAYVYTPMGPRDREWVEAVADGELAGDDFFPWPEPGFGASYWLGRALTQMWASIPWRNPEQPREQAQLLDAHVSLAEAFRLDPANPGIPWREWKEMADMLGDELPAGAPAIPAGEGPPIGYLRRAG